MSMVKLSATISSVLLLFLPWYIQDRQHALGHFDLDDEMMLGAVCAYLSILAASAWYYVIRRSRISGSIHAVLMLGIAVLCFYTGLDILGNSTGKPTPDAVSPVSGLIELFALVSCVFGAVTGFCGVGVLKQVIAKPTTR